MNTQELLECERSRMHKFKKFIFLPNQFKTIGLIVTIAAFASKIVLSYFTDGNENLSFFSAHIVENIIMIAMLAIVVSREKIEDELVESQRGQAFMFAFITGVLFTVFQPYITYMVALLIESGKATFERLDDFIILWFMLVVYLGYFHVLRKTS